MRFNRIVVLVAFFAVVGCIHFPDYPPLVEEKARPQAISIVNVRLFSGATTEALENMDVVARNGRFVSIKPHGGPLPDEGIRIDGKGRTLFPGFTDFHTHASGTPAPPWYFVWPNKEHNLQAYLFAGITQIYDLADFFNVMPGLRKKAAAGKIHSPRIHLAGVPITIHGGHPYAIALDELPWPANVLLADTWAYQIEDPADAGAAVLSVLEQYGSDFIKIVCDELPVGVPQVTDEMLQAVVYAAHKANKKVIVHIGSAENALSAVRAGADAIAHGVYRGRLTHEQAQEIAAAKIPVSPTLVVWNRADLASNEGIVFSKMDRQIESPEIINAFQHRRMGNSDDSERFRDWLVNLNKDRELRAANVQTMYKAGVPIVVGTDSSMTGSIPGSSFHEEMRLLVEAGVPNAVVLFGATGLGAKFLDPQSDYGTIEVGNRADLVLIDGNPLENIEDTTRITLLVKDGVVYNRIPRSGFD